MFFDINSLYLRPEINAATLIGIKYLSLIIKFFQTKKTVMFKHSKSVGMLLTTFGLTTFGVMSANATPMKASIEAVQQQETCTGIVKDATG